MKRIICLLLACLMLVPTALAEDYSSLTNEELKAMISSAQAELKARFEAEHSTEASEFLYASNGKEIRINAFVGKSTDVVIPDEIDGLPVTMLHESAFYDNYDITSVYIPSTITVIPTRTFRACFHFSGVLQIPKTIKEIGYEAFSMLGVLGVIINSSFVTSEGRCCLEYLENLEFVYIKEGNNPVFGSYEFNNCPSLKVAIIPASVSYLPETIFHHSRFLTIVTPDGSYAESWARELFIPVETDTYDAYVELYDSMYPD